MVMKISRKLILVIIAAIILFIVGAAFTSLEVPSSNDIVRGAQLYDQWYAVLGKDAPAGDMPIWKRQSTNTRSGAVTWTCSECHGWDYRGMDGEYRSGSHYTGFPDLFTIVSELSGEEIVRHLNGELDPAHNFSQYLDRSSINQLAIFLKKGIIDDNAYIDPVSLRVIDPDFTHGQQLYQTTCQACHGEAGEKLVLKIEGIRESLGSIANRDPWRFLHRTRFGVAGTDMPIGYELGWQPSDGRDILAYAQSLPTGGEIIGQPTQNPATTPAPLVGGPASNLWTGILTSLGTIAGMAIISVAFIGGFLFLAFIVVVLFRKRSKRGS
jgi:thiosulfate dehydrogenase